MNTLFRLLPFIILATLIILVVPGIKESICS